MSIRYMERFLTVVHVSILTEAWYWGLVLDCFCMRADPDLYPPLKGSKSGARGLGFP